MAKRIEKQSLLGWIGVGLSTAITSFWAFWGIIENFHEGWYQESLLSNIGLMLVQYLSPMLIFMALGLTALYRPRMGSLLHVALAIFAAFFFDNSSNAATLLIIAPFLTIAGLYWFSQFRSRKLASLVLIGIPLLTSILSGIEPVLRVSARVDDGNREARLVRGNGVELIWAPEGQGWPLSGTNWQEAMKACEYLEEHGTVTAAQPQGIWRLPSVEEAVRSMARHGQNSGGVWDAESNTASYMSSPDKESPLWNTLSQVIYWWTATESEEGRAYIIVYDGNVWSRAQESAYGYLGYRCVRDP